MAEAKQAEIFKRAAEEALQKEMLEKSEKQRRLFEHRVALEDQIMFLFSVFLRLTTLFLKYLNDSGHVLKLKMNISR